jgi:LEA14-like dessication related protein
MVPDGRDDAADSRFSNRGLLVGSFVILLVISGALAGLTLDAQIAAANVDSVSVTPTAYEVTNTTHGPQLAVTVSIRNPTRHSITLTSVQARARANGEIIVSAMASERVTVPAGDAVTETLEFGLISDRNESIGTTIRQAKTGIRQNDITFRGTANVRIVNKRLQIGIDTQQ